MLSFILIAMFATIAIAIVWQTHTEQKVHLADVHHLAYLQAEASKENSMLAQKAALANEHNRLQPSYRIIGTEIVKLQVVLLEMLNANANK
jgi:hypothetical protein